MIKEFIMISKLVFKCQGKCLNENRKCTSNIAHTFPSVNTNGILPMKRVIGVDNNGCGVKAGFTTTTWETGLDQLGGGGGANTLR